MNENFRFSVMSAQHRKLYVIHKLIIFLLIIGSVFSAVEITNPVIVTTEERLSISIGALVGSIVVMLAIVNRIKSLFKVKFLTFLVTWILLFSLTKVIDTLVWSIGLVLIPLAIDDLILLPFWRNVWYNNYER